MGLTIVDIHHTCAHTHIICTVKHMHTPPPPPKNTQFSVIDSTTGDGYGDTFDGLGGEDPSGCSSGGDDSGDRNKSDKDPIFIVEEEMRFECRFEEGYDLFDPKYEAWLRIHHPESANKATLKVIQSPALVDPSTSQKSSDSTPSTSGHYMDSSPSTSQKSADSTPSVSKKSGPNTPQSNTSKSSLGSAKRSPLSDLLNLPKVTTPVATKTGKARVLTSSECLRLLREKEETASCRGKGKTKAR